MLHGVGFTGATSVTLLTVAGSIATINNPTVDSDTQLTVTLNPSLLNADLDQLYASVTTPTAVSNTVQVATVVNATTPTLASNIHRWAAMLAALLDHHRAEISMPPAAESTT